MLRIQAITFQLALPQPGYGRRMLLYCRRMFPLAARLLNTVTLYAAFAILICRTNQLPLALVSGWSVLAIWNLLALAFILRLMDELKDRDIDEQLFSDRPLPSGAVLESDIRFTLWGTILITVAVNLLSPDTLWLVLVCLAYTGLMFVYFFALDYLRRHLLTNLATHNPSVPLFFLMTASIIAAQHRVAALQIMGPATLAVIAMFWALVLSWELSRKIRSREEENDYVTYSQIFGPTAAALITLAIQAVPVLVGYWFVTNHTITPLLFGLLVAAFLGPLFGSVRFILSPSQRTSRLRPFAEAYAASVSLAVIIDKIANGIGG